MTKKIIWITVFTLSCLFALPATSAQINTSSQTLTKDEWFSILTPLIPKTVCTDFFKDKKYVKRFQKINMSYEKCVSLMPLSVSKCQSEIYAKVPGSIDRKASSIWSKKFGRCIGKDFAKQNIINH